MAENYKRRMQITINEKTKQLLEMLKEDNKGISASEIIDNAIWLWAKEQSSETIEMMHKRNIEKVGVK
ncbi:hypothetical protein QTH32_01220 [Clostridium perfringens]|nr:hypothetical protein [Clostridium perfringens]